MKHLHFAQPRIDIIFIDTVFITFKALNKVNITSELYRIILQNFF